MANLSFIFDHSFTVLESLALLIYLSMFLHKRRKGRSQFLIAILIISVAQKTMSFFLIHASLKIGVSILLDLLIAKAYFHGATLKKVFLVSGFFIISATSTGISVGILSFFTHVYTSNIANLDNPITYLVAIFYILTLIFCLYVFERFRKVQAYI